MATKVKFQTSQPLEAGAHQAVVFAVNDLGEQPGYQDEGIKWQYAIGLEFPNGNGSSRTQWITVNRSLHPKSTLGKMVSAAGITTKDEFDPAELIGRNVTAIVELVDRGGVSYANVVGFSHLGRGSTPVSPKHSPNAEMPEWLRTKLRNRLDKPRAEVSGTGTVNKGTTW